MGIIQLSLFGGKVCGTCGELKPYDDFSLSAQGKMGLRAHCKVCRANQARDDYDPEKNRKSKLKSADKIRAWSRAWREKNYARAIEKDRRRYASDPEKERERLREYRRRNPELLREQQKERNKKQKYKLKAIRDAYIRRRRIGGIAGRFTDIEWESMCEKYGHICLCCGEKKVLTLDHIIPVSKGGRHEAENIQPLCRACNSRKSTKTIDYRP